MIHLPNGCKRSEFNVFPENWKTKTANIKIPWYFTYRFYSADGKVKQLHLRGTVNRFHTYLARKQAMEVILDDEEQRLLNGYNPISNQTIAPDVEEFGISPSTPFLPALNQAFQFVKVSKSMHDSMKSMLTIIGKRLTGNNLLQFPVENISVKHIIYMLNKLSDLQDLSAISFNHYRAYLMKLFNVLIQQEAVKANPVKSIEKRKVLKKIRETLTDEERHKVNEHLRENNYTFWRYLHIFFHSGARTTELFSVKYESVDLAGQRYKRTVNKGEGPREVWTTIKDIALPLWQEIMSEGSPGNYLFSRGLKPGNKPIRPDQITKRWTKHAKKKFGITADFYSLKHLNTSETLEYLTEVEIAKHNAHTSTAMVRSIYDVQRERREHERMKKVPNKFA